MTFHVGQKVVLATHEVPASAQHQLRRKGGWSAKMYIGSIWTIRDIDARYIPFFGFPALRFEEHAGTIRHVAGYGDIESGFPAPCFRPVTERKTDISIFKKLLQPNSKIIERV